MLIANKLAFLKRLKRRFPLYIIASTSLFCLFSLLNLNAQNEPLQFRKLTIEDGLSSMQVYSILQDKDGYIWMGTEAGLSRFDGYKFKTYTIRDGLPSNDVLNVYEDSQGRIWLNLIGSICFLEGDSVRIIENDLDDISIGYTITELENGEFLISSQHRLYKLDKNFNLSPIYTISSGPRRFVLVSMPNKKDVWIYDSQKFYRYQDGDIKQTEPIIFNKKNTVNYNTAIPFGNKIIYNTEW